MTSANLQNSGSTVIYAGISGSQDGGGAIPGHTVCDQEREHGDRHQGLDRHLALPVTNDTSDAHVFNPDHFDISSIAVDPHDATGGTVYATVMGFGVPHLYRSTTFGSALAEHQREPA